MEEFQPGLFVHVGRHEEMLPENHGDIGNSGFIVGDHSVAVIDPGGSAVAARTLMSRIRQITDLPIDYLILTHFHPDHVAGASVFAEATHTIAHHHYIRAVAQRSVFYIERFADLMESTSPEAFGVPDTVVEDSLVIDLGNRELELVAHAVGHTDNDLSVYDRNTETLWASDLIFVERMPSLDGSLTGWLNVLEQLNAANYPYVVPGHGRPSAWRDAVDPQWDYLKTLKKSVKKAISNGKTLSQVLEPGAIDSAGEWLLRDTQHFTNITKAYIELEWE